MRNAAFTLALTLASTPFAFGLDVRSYAVKETVAVPTGWKRVAAAPSNHKIKLQIGLYQENFESLERQLWEVSDRMFIWLRYVFAWL
jgi:tripeptidyl-peptidase-1